MRGRTGVAGRWATVLAAMAAGLVLGRVSGRRAGGVDAERQAAVSPAGGGDADRGAYKTARRLQEVLDLRGRVDRLAASLADAEARADRGALGAARAGGGTVLAVDDRLGLVVFSGGAGSGRRRGQVMEVERDGMWVARVRVVEVRPEVSGARVESVRPGWAPQPGDRVDADAGEQRER